MAPVVKNPPANTGDMRDAGLNPWVRKIHWRRAWQPTPIFLPGKSNGQRSLWATVHSVGRVGGNWRDSACTVQKEGGASQTLRTRGMGWKGIVRGRQIAIMIKVKLLSESKLNLNIFWLSVSQFSHSVVSNSLRPHGLQHARPPCPTHRVYSDSCPLSRWCHPTISSSVICFSSHLQSFPESRSFQMSQFFASGGQSIGVSASASFLPMNIQDWFPLGWTDYSSKHFINC